MRFFTICVKYYKGYKLTVDEDRDFGRFIHTHSTEDIIEPIAILTAFVTSPIRTLRRFYCGDSKD